MLTKTTDGNLLYDLRKKILQMREELSSLDSSMSDIPELIISANLLRSNEHLLKINSKKTELLSAYAQYSKILEELLTSVFEIQNDLKDIMHEQSSLISKSTPRTKSTPKTKSRKK